MLVWGSDLPPIRPQDRLERDDVGLRFFLGWMIDPVSGKAVERVPETTLDPDSRANGEYAALKATSDGDVAVWRNMMASVQIYYSDAPDRFVASTRASIACYGRTLSTRFDLDPDFARSALSASIALNDHSMFQGVESLPQASTIYRPPDRRPVIHREEEQPLYDEEMRRLYANNRDTYWDNAFESITALTRASDSGNLPITVPLSRGQSRLLLGLITASGRADRIESVLTWGPPGSPDIRSAKAVAGALGLGDKHEFRLSAFPAPKVMRRAKFLQHDFVSEGEMSPQLFTGKVPPRSNIQLHGQEGRLRNIAGKRHFETSQELPQWFRIH